MALHSVAQAFTVCTSSSSVITKQSTTIFKYTAASNARASSSASSTTTGTHLLASNENDNDNDNDDSSNDYPLEIPSPVLLATSMVLAIASTGSIFELSGGSPVVGVGPSVAIAVTGIPTCFFLFYAAIKKGIAETEADDAEFQNQNKRRNNKF